MYISFYTLGLPILVAAVCVIVLLLIILRRALLSILCTIGFIAGLFLLVAGLSEPGLAESGTAWSPDLLLRHTVLPGAIIVAASLLALALGQRQQKKD